MGKPTPLAAARAEGAGGDAGVLPARPAARHPSLRWRVLRPPPDPIPVRYQDTTDDCIPTPPEVESFAATFPGRSDPIFRKDQATEMCGLRTAAGHRAWHATTIDSMELCFQRPAGGF